MALLQTVTPEHLPANYSLQIAVYRDVKNASFLQQQLLAGNTDFEYAFIDATVVSASMFFRSSMREGKGRKGKGREGKGREGRGCLYLSSPFTFQACHVHNEVLHISHANRLLDTVQSPRIVSRIPSCK